MNLSKYFTLEQMTFSATAVRKGIDNRATSEVLTNLTNLCKALDKIKDLLGKPINITSGYRCPELNKAIGGAKNSQHIEGKAADIQVHGMTTEQLYQFIKVSGIEYCQLIQEFDSWVHISYDASNNKKENLKAVKQNGKTVYMKY